MIKSKIQQQKWLARILIGCAIVIIFLSFLQHQFNTNFVIGILFLAVGIATLRRAIKDELDSKD
ncbi:MAG: hypothetical protein JNL70_10280 [Saprospiraceae bacterium]|nr:hypothetical protein [Saprospiraceae bacterium]